MKCPNSGMNDLDCRRYLHQLVVTIDTGQAILVAKMLTTLTKITHLKLCANAKGVKIIFSGGHIFRLRH